MKAWVCREWGPVERLRLEDLPEPEPGPRQVRIRVAAASLNYPDVLVAEGKYQHRPAFPFSPGSEAVGVVDAAGPGVTRVAVGQRVAAFTLWGAFAERCLADEDRVAPLPEAVDDVAAAASILVGGTALHALEDRAALAPGETLLVLGAAGGTGVAAIGVGKMLGAHVIAAASSERKLSLCRDLGADAGIDYVREDLRTRLRELTDGRGPDVVFDPVGGDFTEQALRSMAWRGRLLIVGFAAGAIPRLPPNLALLRGSAVIGANWGEFTRLEPEANRRQIARLAEWLGSGRLRLPVTETIALADVRDALGRMARRETMGKVVVRFAA